MKRFIAFTTCLGVLLAATLASADISKDDRWLRIDGEWRAIHQVLDCTYGEWTLATRADGSRYIGRAKACTGHEVMNLGVLPE